MQFMTPGDLQSRHCREYPAGSAPLPEASREALGRAVQDWKPIKVGKAIRRTFRLADFAAAIAFVGEVAQIAEREQHHPEIRVHGYRRVTLEFTTHSVGDLTENDFIMAAKLDALFDARGVRT